jgi:hypothetical protein
MLDIFFAPIDNFACWLACDDEMRRWLTYEPDWHMNLIGRWTWLADEPDWQMNLIDRWTWWTDEPDGPDTVYLLFQAKSTHINARLHGARGGGTPVPVPAMFQWAKL